MVADLVVPMVVPMVLAAAARVEDALVGMKGTVEVERKAAEAVTGREVVATEDAGQQVERVAERAGP